MVLAPAAGLPASLLAPLCAAGLLISAAVVRLMIRIGVLDQPGHRSSHVRPTPKGGGVGPVVALLLMLPIAILLSHATVASWRVAVLLVAVAALALVSWLDDLRQYRPIVKLVAQLMCAGLVTTLLVPIATGAWLAVAIGFCWLMFVTNALNFIDGLNGLAAGSMALCGMALGLDAADPLQAGTGLLLCAGLIGFLPFNYPRARIFMGDVGSQAAGLAIAACALLHWESNRSAGGLLSGPLLLAGILYDVAFTLCRRMLGGERLSEAHRGHLYQVAFRSGVAAWLIALVHWIFVLWGAVLMLMVERNSNLLVPVIAAAALPQIVWTALVIARARGRAIGPW